MVVVVVTRSNCHGNGRDVGHYGGRGSGRGS